MFHASFLPLREGCTTHSFPPQSSTLYTEPASTWETALAKRADVSNLGCCSPKKLGTTTQRQKVDFLSNRSVLLGPLPDSQQVLYLSNATATSKKDEGGSSLTQ